jgi:hypothetical protein
MPLPSDFLSRLLASGPGTFGEAWNTMLTDGWRRYADIGSRYGEGAMKTAMEAGIRAERTEDLMVHALRLGCNFATEMARIPALAFTRAVIEHGRQSLRPSAANNAHVVDGRPVMLPLRFQAAKQGWALYCPDAEKAQSMLGPDASAFEVCRFRGKAMLMLYAIDFEQTDFGGYREIGVELWVRPKDNPTLLPGTVVIRMSVDSEWSRTASNAIWHFDKLLTPHMAPTYRAQSVTFPMHDADANTLAITLPRFGSGRSTDVPLQYFTIDRSAGPRGGQPLSTVFHRSAHGEGMQFGGDVQLRLGDGTGGNCFCGVDAKKPVVCTCERLRDLGLPALRPFANGWAEHMSGRVDAAFALPPSLAKAEASETSRETPPKANGTTPTSPSPRRRTARPRP